MCLKLVDGVGIPEALLRVVCRRWACRFYPPRQELTDCWETCRTEPGVLVLKDVSPAPLEGGGRSKAPVC